jgi:hypothetical protein
MGDVNAWIQTNWQELGTFLVEVAFLIAAVWFAHNILKALRAFQEQIGALLKLTITPSAGEREAPQTSARSNLAETSPYWLTPSESQGGQTEQTAEVREPIESGPSWIVRAWGGVIAWMTTPMKSAHVGAWHRVVNWLRSPARS